MAGGGNQGIDSITGFVFEDRIVIEDQILAGVAIGAGDKAAVINYGFGFIVLNSIDPNDLFPQTDGSDVLVLLV